jgi:RHS repeat-associated protein
MTDASTPHPQITRQAVYTAFGERVWTAGGSTATRYGYAGAHGYEEKLLPKPYGSPDFGFVHVGARWYDPSTGRFLERDPMSVRGGMNLYAYVEGNPLSRIDPLGLRGGIDWGYENPSVLLERWGNKQLGHGHKKKHRKRHKERNETPQEELDKLNSMFGRCMGVFRGHNTIYVVPSSWRLM